MMMLKGRTLRYIRLAFVCAWIWPALPASSAGAADAQPSGLAVTVKDGKISVAVRKAVFSDVINAVSRQSGIKISMLGNIKDTLTDTFEGLPLEQGLMRLIMGQNYICVYTAKGNDSILTQVIVLPMIEGTPPPPTPPAPALKDGHSPKDASAAQEKKPGEEGQNAAEEDNPFLRAIKESQEKDKAQQAEIQKSN